MEAIYVNEIDVLRLRRISKARSTLESLESLVPDDRIVESIHTLCRIVQKPHFRYLIVQSVVSDDRIIIYSSFRKKRMRTKQY